MSSDSTRHAQNPETDHLPGTQKPVSAQQVEPVQQTAQVKQSPPRGLLSTATSGQDLACKQQRRVPGQAPLEQGQTAISKMSDFVQDFQRDLVFRVDEEGDRLVVNVVDSETQAVIRRIPSED